MSLVAPAIAARNILRSGLTNFYDQTAAESDDSKQISRRKASIKVMPDDRPTPACGREFIGVYASAWEVLDDQLYGLHERVTITVALTHRYGDVPFDRLGEAAYVADEDVFIQQYATISDRLRQIVTLLHADFAGFQTEMTALLAQGNTADGVAGTRQAAYDKLWFIGADSAPKIVGPDHFFASDSTKAPSGLLMKAKFRGASRLHWMTTLDQTS